MVQGLAALAAENQSKLEPDAASQQATELPSLTVDCRNRAAVLDRVVWLRPMVGKTREQIY